MYEKKKKLCMKKATYVESQNAISHLMSTETLHSVHSVFTSIEERHFDVRRVLCKDRRLLVHSTAEQMFL